MSEARSSGLRTRSQRFYKACSLALLMSLWAASGCGDPDASPDQERGLHGTVRDAVSGKRLQGVSVQFRSDTLDEAGDKSDEDGDYTIFVSTDARNGRIEAKKSGYETRVVSVYFDDEDVQVNIELNPS